MINSLNETQAIVINGQFNILTNNLNRRNDSYSAAIGNNHNISFLIHNTANEVERYQWT